MTNEFYPSLEDVKKRIESLQEEKRVLEWKIKEMNDELRRISDELILLYKLQEFLQHGFIVSED